MSAQAPGAIRVRPATRDDFTRWKPLWDGYNAFYERVGPTALPDEVTATSWDRFHDPAEPMHALVAELDGRLVGLAHYLFHRSTSRLALTCYLQDLFTDASVRGRGVGRALIAAVYAAARDAGSVRVYWMTHRTNEVAMRLYDKVARNSGFVVYEQSV